MPLLRINATDTGLQHHPGSGPDPLVHPTCAAAPGPAIIMVHGYKYAPGHPTHCPHRKIFGNCTTDWPRALGFDGAAADEGLGIAFGWYARGPLWQVHRRAAAMGQCLASLIKTLRDAAPDRPVHVIAHSMGSEIALSALASLRPGAVERMVLLTGASFASHARTMLTTPAGLATEVFNITSRENDLFDLAFEHLVPAPRVHDAALGCGIDLPHVTNLQLDCAATLSAMAQLGLPVAAPQRRVCHWSSYKRPGAMDLYARLLRDPESLTQTELQQHLPDAMAPRWSRLMRQREGTAPLHHVSARVAAAARILRSGTRSFAGATPPGKAGKAAY